jgi:hypothetical protein
MDRSGTEHAMSQLATDANGADETRTLSATAIAIVSDDGSAAIGAASEDIDDVQTLPREPSTLVAATMAAAAAAVENVPPFDPVGAEADSTSNLYAIILNREYNLLVPPVLI